MNPCTEFREALTGHALGEPLRSRESGHLAGCAECTAFLSAMRARAARLDAGLSALAVAEPRAGFVDRVVAGARAAADHRWSRIYWRFALPALGLSAVILVTLETRLHGPQHESTVAAARELIAWRSPTGFLLRSPVEPLLRDIPRIGRAPMTGDIHEQ